MTNDTRGLRRTVTEHYSALARKAAGASDDSIPLIMVGGAADACCDDSCCIPEGMEDISNIERLYASGETEGLPLTVLEAVAGCGNPGAIAELRPGETVLIWGIGGGVAQAALQIVKLLGGFAIVTSGAAHKLEAARRLGADAVLDHGNVDVVAEVRRLTDGRGADVVVDSVGEKTWGSTLRALKRGGRLVTCGATSGPRVELDLRRLFWHQWSLLGSTMGSRREYREIVRLAGQGRLWPIVDRVVPLENAIDAFSRLASGEQFGKLVVEVSHE